MATSTSGKWAAELNDTGATARRYRPNKWGDIVLKRGVSEVPPSSLITLRAGQDFTLTVAQRETSQDTLTDLRAAAARHAALDLTLSDATPQTSALGRCIKVEALTIKQKVTESGAVVEIQLRKL